MPVASQLVLSSPQRALPTETKVESGTSQSGTSLELSNSGDLKKKSGLLPESQVQNLVLAVLDVPHSLDSGKAHNLFTRWRLSGMYHIE